MILVPAIIGNATFQRFVALLEVSEGNTLYEDLLIYLLFNVRRKVCARKTVYFSMIVVFGSLRLRFHIFAMRERM
jgi:hypothetical protein